MVSGIISSSPLVKSKFTVVLIPLRFASETSDIGKFRLRKLVALFKVAGALVVTCMQMRPKLAYFTLTPNGGAFYRDILYVAILKTFGVRRLYHLHGKGIKEASRHFISRFIYRWAFRGANVILLSPRLLSDAAGIVDTKKVFILANGIPDPLIGKNVCLLKSKNQRPPRILFFSNIVVSKGSFVLLEALTMLNSQGYEFTATFAGAWQSKKVEQKFNDYISAFGLGGKVFYVGPKFDVEKTNAFADADILAFPTFKDTFPLVVLEGMAHGLPVVTTFEGAIPDMVLDGETGFLVPQQDVAALADRLAQLLINDELRLRLGQAGRERYQTYFTEDVFTGNLLAIFDKCLSTEADVH